MAYGMAGHLALSFQSSFGTSNTNSQYFIPMISESVAETIAQLVEGNLYARFNEAPYHEGIHEVRGEIRTEAHPIYVGALLKAALGRVTTTPQNSAFLHEFLPVGSDWDDSVAVPPLTFEINRDVGSAFVYYDVAATALSFEIAQGQLLAAGLAIAGGRSARKAKATPAFRAGNPWTWAVASASYDGLGVSDVVKLALTFDNQLHPVFTLGGDRSASRIRRSGPQTVEVEGSMLFVSQTQYQEFLNQSEKRLLVTFRGDTVSTSYAAQLTLDVPRLRFSEFAPQIGGPGQIEVGFKGRGMVDPASGYALRATLTNTQPAY
jgi:hypothetical protein